MTKNIKIPTSLNEITVAQWLQFKKAIKGEEENENYLRMAMVTIFCKLPLEVARGIEKNDFDFIVNKLNDVLQEKPKHSTFFIMDGVKYGFIPNLETMTAGEYIDLDTLIQKEETATNALAVMYRKVTHEVKGLYQIEDYRPSEEKANVMLECPLGVWLGAQVFFWTLSIDLLNATISYLQNLKQTTKGMTEEDLQNVGDGISRFIPLLTEASLNLKKLQNLTYIHS